MRIIDLSVFNFTIEMKQLLFYDILDFVWKSIATIPKKWSSAHACKVSY